MTAGLELPGINVDELYNFPNEFIPETGGTYTNAGRPARWVAWEERDGVRVRVVYEPAGGKIVTAFPDSNPTPPTLKPIKKSCG
ncbi:hypothetical protein CWS02_00290 [Enterobacter sp. EA-1]|nr:hypothetical protein CWS02_00290 [Enterobacter sp. EA-1]